jgi:hypothetical protein
MDMTISLEEDWVFRCRQVVKERLQLAIQPVAFKEASAPGVQRTQ